MNLSAKTALIDIACRVGIFVDLDEIFLEVARNGETHLHISETKISKDCGLEGSQTFVITTISSRGSFNSLIALPKMTSDRPLEYTFIGVED